MEEGEQRMKDGGRRRKGDERISERRGTSEMWDNEGKGKKRRRVPTRQRFQTNTLQFSVKQQRKYQMNVPGKKKKTFT